MSLQFHRFEPDGNCTYLGTRIMGEMFRNAQLGETEKATRKGSHGGAISLDADIIVAKSRDFPSFPSVSFSVVISPV